MLVDSRGRKTCAPIYRSQPSHQRAAQAPEAASDGSGAPRRADWAKGALCWEFRTFCQPSSQCTRGARPTSGGRQRRLYLLVHRASTSDEARLGTVQGRPPLREVGRGPARQGACHRAKGALGSETRASCRTSNPCNRGPRPTSGGRQQRLCPMVYGANTPDAPRLETVKGRPPKGARGTVAPEGAA